MISEKIASLKALIESLEEDATKVDNGNKSAGVRVRKALQEAINTSKEIRKDVIESRSEG
jgi:hypothetical protein